MVCFEKKYPGIDEGFDQRIQQRVNKQINADVSISSRAPNTSSVEIEMSVFSDKTPQRSSSYSAQEEQSKSAASREI